VVTVLLVDPFMDDAEIQMAIQLHPNLVLIPSAVREKVAQLEVLLIFLKKAQFIPAVLVEQYDSLD